MLQNCDSWRVSSSKIRRSFLQPVTQYEDYDDSDGDAKLLSVVADAGVDDGEGFYCDRNTTQSPANFQTKVTVQLRYFKLSKFLLLGPTRYLIDFTSYKISQLTVGLF